MVEEIYMKDFKEKVQKSDCHTVLLVYQKDCELSQYVFVSLRLQY